ncbi:CocE/NonD family hydrolase [Nonomuraea sp. NPDC047529]|uniref:CocE/NonD family hydrolase n=1 Tax=Nonomuraea sp. NPDC047529 TaxID=3155623 RepID=UPI00340404E9
MIGLSYDGTLAEAVAARGEGLRTIVPEGAISSWYDYARDRDRLSRFPAGSHVVRSGRFVGCGHPRRHARHERDPDLHRRPHAVRSGNDRQPVGRRTLPARLPRGPLALAPRVKPTKLPIVTRGSIDVKNRDSVTRPKAVAPARRTP